MPGAAVATMSRAPEDTRRFEIRLQAVVREVLEQGLVGGQRCGPARRRGPSAAPGRRTTSS